MPRADVLVPPMLYLPVWAPHGDDLRIAVVATLADGRAGLLVYTALDRLADLCGDEQAWILVPTADLDKIKDVQPFDVVAFDLEARDLLRTIREAS